MAATGGRWVLAFEGSCGACRAIAAAVAQSSDGKLDVLPLNHPDVQQWRRDCFGANPRATPTLFHVASGGTVRAWTGPRMSARLVRLLGVPTSGSVLRSLGRLRAASEKSTPAESVRPGVISRKRFLQLGAGAVVAGGIMITGAAPAYADPVTAWLQANSNSLPTTFDEFIRLPVEYRRAVYGYLDSAQKSAVWTAQLDWYTSQHSDLDNERRQFIEMVRAIVGNASSFSGGQDPEWTQNLKADAMRLFGTTEATALIAMIGSGDEPIAGQDLLAADCTCASRSDYCGSTSCHQGWGGCRQTSGGCGTLWAYDCDGQCA